jgi:hypothetical protein
LPGAYPTDAALSSLFFSQFCGAFHDKVTQGIIAVNQCRSGSLANDLYIGSRVNSAILNLFHILGQPKYSVGVRATRIGFVH